MMVLPFEKDRYTTAIDLLTRASLPVEDISDRTELFALKLGEETVGTIGLEHNGAVGLLRSLSVKEESRGKGYGDELVRFLEQEASRKGITTLYLLTTTAAAFFAKRGYVVIDRTDVPPFVQQSSEFSSVCPSSATMMKKAIA